MKKIIILFILLIPLFEFKEKNIGSISKVTCEEAYDFVADDALLVDVREKDEYDLDDLEKNINISYKEIENISKYADKDTKIIVYCKSGKRSNIAANKLLELGYKHIYDLGSIESCG